MRQPLLAIVFVLSIVTLAGGVAALVLKLSSPVSRVRVDPGDPDARTIEARIEVSLVSAMDVESRREVYSQAIDWAIKNHDRDGSLSLLRRVSADAIREGFHEEAKRGLEGVLEVATAPNERADAYRLLCKASTGDFIEQAELASLGLAELKQIDEFTELFVGVEHELWQTLGSALAAQDLWEESALAYERAIERLGSRGLGDKQLGALYQSAGTSYERAGLVETAEQWYGALLERYPHAHGDPSRELALRVKHATLAPVEGGERAERLEAVWMQHARRSEADDAVARSMAICHELKSLGEADKASRVLGEIVDDLLVGSWRNRIVADF